MDDHVSRLSELTASRRWPNRWMTLREIDAELEHQYFWEDAGLTAWSVEGRLHWLRRALASEQGLPRRAVWLRMGSQYKHFRLVLKTRHDADTYLDWLAAVREAQAARAEELVRGEWRGEGLALHPLAPAPEECLRIAEGYARQVIAAIPDATVADRLQRVWAGYEVSRPVHSLACLRVCRLIYAAGVLYLGSLREQGIILDNDAPAELRALQLVVSQAERWLASVYCAPAGAEVEEPAQLEAA